MSDATPQGRRFSQMYLAPEKLVADSPRLRKRLTNKLRTAIGDQSFEIGKYLENEIGIILVRSNGYSAYLDYNYLEHGELRDILDSITLVGRMLPAIRSPMQKTFLPEIQRIFTEESASYRLDDAFGVHPAIDSAYQANRAAAVRSLSPAYFEAARTHLQRADDQLLPSGDARESIRAAFDAVENIFRQLFIRATHINTTTIKSDLRPLVDRHHADGAEKRTAAKMVEALSDWVDACHNYRHETGSPEVIRPNEELTVLLVSQGISFARWLGDLLQKTRSTD